MNDIDFEDSESLPLNDPCSPRKKVSLIDIISSTDETVKTEKPDFDLDTSQESIDLTEEPSESGKQFMKGDVQYHGNFFAKKHQRHWALSVIWREK
jgi:hypothetical protein